MTDKELIEKQKKGFSDSLDALFKFEDIRHTQLKRLIVNNFEYFCQNLIKSINTKEE